MEQQIKDTDKQQSENNNIKIDLQSADNQLDQGMTMNGSNSADGSSSCSASQIYITFEELQQSGLVYDIIDEINEENKDRLYDIKSEISNQTNWKGQFVAIDQLRSLNKFRSEELCQKLLPHVFDYIITLVDSIRSNLSKNALLLLNEIFQINPLSSLHPSYFPLIHRKLLDKAISDKQFLKQEAKNALLSIEKNKEGLYEYNLQAICDLIFDKNANICELACQTLNNIIMNHKENIPSIQEQTYNTLTCTLLKCLQGKRALLKKLSKEICTVLHQIKGDHAFDSLGQNEQVIIISAISQPKNDSKPSFRDFLAQKKNTQI